MDEQLIADALTGDSDEIEELKANLHILEGFIQLARDLDEMPEITKRFYEESRSLYQGTSINRSITDLETILAKFFGPPVKPAGKPLPRKLRKNSSVKYLGGIENDQSLFLIPLKTGEFYGALWPWRRNKAKIEIHMGYCSDWMVDDQYLQLERLVKRSLSHSAFQKMDAAAGGQIRGVGLPSFLQMAEMEQSSFCLIVTSPERSGKLHIAEGVLIDAETVNHTGRDAAYHIIAWDEITIQIAPADPSKTDEIQQPLMHILMESLKIKDEITSTSDAPPMLPPRMSRSGSAGTGKRLVRLERAPAPKSRAKQFSMLRMAVIATATFVIGGSLIVLGFYLHSIRAESFQFELLNRHVEKADSFKEKRALLEKYLQSNPGSPHTSDINARLKQIANAVEDRDFDKTVLSVSSLPVDENYERKAIELYGDFLEKYPDSRYQKRISTAIGNVKAMLDKYYYEELKRAARMDFGRRLQTYKDYLKRFPEGRYHQDVNVLITEMGRQHLNFLRTEDAQCDKIKRWEPCIKRYQSFIGEFNGTPLADEAGKLVAAMRDKEDLVQLREARDQAGNDFEKAARAYQAYLDTHPASTQKSTIEAELGELKKKFSDQRQWEAVRSYVSNRSNGLFERIQKLDRFLTDHHAGPYAGDAQDFMQQLEMERQTTLQQRKRDAQRQEQLAREQREKERLARQKIVVEQTRAALTEQLSRQTRYRANGDDTFTDKNTGQMWTLTDSYQELGGCIDWDAAQQYVQGLRVGGFSDWRLPNANELAAIYKNPPYFPASGADWYWTSERFSKGYHYVVDVVTAKPETVFKREKRTTDECGAVRAVRP